MNPTKPAKWFRMYAEFATDPKVQMLSESDQRRYMMLLCLRCGNGDVTLQDSEIAFQLRISEQDWLSTKAALLSKCLINADSKPSAWDKRQFVSDSSAERVAAHRERNKAACNVTVTPPETETETETDTKEVKSIAQKNPASSTKLNGFAEFWSAYPRKKNKGDAEKAWKTLSPCDELAAQILAAVAFAKLGADWTKDGGTFIPYPASWLRAKGWEDAVQAGGYTDEALEVIGSYNATLAAIGWPDAVIDQFSHGRADAIAAFLNLRSKDGWVGTYFKWMADNLTAKPGYGFDWVIKPETVLRAREGNFQALKEAA